MALGRSILDYYPQVPMTKDLNRYPGQMGVPGADFDAGLRWNSRAVVLHVDKTNPRADDNNDAQTPGTRS